MSNLLEYARREFAILNAMSEGPDDKEDDPEVALIAEHWDKAVEEAVLELLEVFSAQGHSGFSAGTVAHYFSELAMFSPLSPLTGEDSEWNDISEFEDGRSVWQNRRCSHVFKDETGAYDSNGRVFREPNGVTYTSNDSRVPVTFPYWPSPTFVDVPGKDSDA